MSNTPQTEQESIKQPVISVIGGGSWATAIVKVLTDHHDYIGWWVRNPETATYIKRNHHNPKYLSSVELRTENLDIHTDINQIVELSDYLIFVVPSAFLKSALSDLKVSLQNKVVFSAIKGIVPGDNLIVGDYFHEVMGVPLEQIGVLTGPTHAEEVSMERLSYLTVASISAEHRGFMAKALQCSYLKVHESDDIYGTEYAAVLKNIYSLAAGICHGLGYGDNFQAVLVSNAVREMKKFIKAVKPIKRDINGTAYLGDLLVTAYSQFSRNRMFGTMIGKGYTIRSAMLEMNMVAEGYYAAALLTNIKKRYEVKMPIAQAVYKILYEGKSPRVIMEKLAQKMT
jgi:glycerol-3-phosphate dehydrogenase (NAD(P)+)